MTYKEAADVLDLTHVWDMAPNPNGTPCPTRGGVVKSPLRVDQKGESFSVTRDLKLFKDHAEAEHKGGVYSFIALCKPEWSKAEIVREMIVRAGGDPDAKDPNYKRPSIADWRAEKQKAAEGAGKRWDREQRKLVTLPKLERWSAVVSQRFAKGIELAESDGNWQANLAQERGWPLEWVESLVSMGVMAATPKQGVMFLVEAVSPKTGNFGEVGTHERWLTDDGRKMWSYRPCPKWDQAEVAAWPFRLGNPDSKVWIITEGQWDAVTVYGLLGGFDDTMLCDVFVIGIRGASGVGVFMAGYEKMLRAQAPHIALFPDGDAAGEAWIKDRRAGAGELPKWCFARKLREVFGVRVKWFRSTQHKDLNDWYRDGDLESAILVNTIDKVIS